MTDQPVSLFARELLPVLTETFESVEGIFLDRGTSLIETLSTISAEEASVPVGSKCATIAAQVAHICFYLDVLEHFFQTGENLQADWGEVWRTVHTVTPEAWAASQERLNQAYLRLRVRVETFDRWEDEDHMGDAIAIVVHTAYHLGEIRQALCTLKA